MSPATLTHCASSSWLCSAILHFHLCPTPSRSGRWSRLPSVDRGNRKRHRGSGPCGRPRCSEPRTSPWIDCEAKPGGGTGGHGSAGRGFSAALYRAVVTVGPRPAVMPITARQVALLPLVGCHRGHQEALQPLLWWPPGAKILEDL